MLDLMTKRRARVLLRLSAEELRRDRQFQAALHLYMGRVDLWYRELHDIPEEDIRADKASHLEQIARVDPDFLSKIAVEWRDGKGIGLQRDGTTRFRHATAAIISDESHLYFFDEGWPMKWQTWLREEDCIPCGIFHLNSGPGVVEAALEKLKADDPNTRITTPKLLDWARYNCFPVAIKAIGTHEAKLTKPLKRCGVRKGDPEEVLNMHTGEWQPTGFVMNWS